MSACVETLGVRCDQRRNLLAFSLCGASCTTYHLSMMIAFHRYGEGVRTTAFRPSFNAAGARIWSYRCV